MSHVSNDHKADARAAFLGLILGAIAIFGIVRGIVYLTNQKYAGHAEATKAP